MNLLDMYVRVSAKDEASDEIGQIADNIIGRLGSAAGKAAKLLAGLWAGNQVIQFGKQAFQAYSQFEQLEGGVAKLYGNAGMSVEQYAESVGKSIDQVQADYQRNAEAQRMVMENAQQAWKTAGMDANSYMQTATSFSAALINSLGGDTKEAARLTDEAMVAMSDNVNTFGSDMGSVQNAFQGFAKQNYTMLDNLKLGYGGTKTEMERLVKDAAAMTQEQKDLNMTVDEGSLSFDNIVKAIQVMQKHQGIYGTTTREAMNTIEGSMNATKAAWQNLIAEFGKPDADIGARVAEMITAVFGENGEGGLVRNVATTAGRIATTMVRAVGNGVKAGFDWLVSNGPRMVLDAVRGMIDVLNGAASSIATFDLGSFLSGMDVGGIFESILNAGSDIGEIFREWEPDIRDAVTNLMNAIGTFVQTNGPVMLEALGNLFNNAVTFIVEHGPEIVGSVSEAFLSLVEWVSSNGPTLVERVAEIVGNVIETVRQWLVDNGPTILAAALEMFGNIIQAIVTHVPTILANVATMVGMIIGYLGSAATQMLTAALEFVGGFLDGSSQKGEEVRTWFSELPSKLLTALGNVGSILFNAGKNILQGFWDGLTSKWSEVSDWVSGIGGWIAEHKGPKQYDLDLLVNNGKWIMSGLQRGLEEGLPPVEDTLRDITGAIQTGINTDAKVNVAQTSDSSAVVAALAAILDAMPKGVYLDSKTLVGSLAPQMDYAMGGLL